MIGGSSKPVRMGLASEGAGKTRMRYHHIGVPTTAARPGEEYLAGPEHETWPGGAVENV